MFLLEKSCIPQILSAIPRMEDWSFYFTSPKWVQPTQWDFKTSIKSQAKAIQVVW